MSLANALCFSDSMPLRLPLRYADAKSIAAPKIARKKRPTLEEKNETAFRSIILSVPAK
jgi:hypothetical protein